MEHCAYGNHSTHDYRTATDTELNPDFDEQGAFIGIEVLAASSKQPEYLLESAERLDAEGA